eukprot:gene7636-8437_t
MKSVALVTGASRGIGRAIALALAEADCHIAINYKANDDAARKVYEEAQRISSSFGNKVFLIKADCSRSEEVKELFAQVKKELGNVDILINNAGITRDKIGLTMKPNDFTDVTDLNLNGVFYCSQAAFSMMMRRKHGRIINIASVVGQIGNVGQINYSAAKAGVIGMTRAMAKEFATRGVCVNAVCPGFIESDMSKHLKKDDILPSIPLGRLGTPEEVAGLVKFLAVDPAAAYMTGHCYNIDGGLAIGAT